MECRNHPNQAVSQGPKFSGGLARLAFLKIGREIVQLICNAGIPQSSQMAAISLWHCECNRAIKAIRQLGQISMNPEDTMRSELVFGAMTYVSNRFLLTRVTATATRKLHRPNTRIQDTANEVFGRFRHANPLPVGSCIGNLEPRLAVAQAGPHKFYQEPEQSVA